jgi:hypothetical protein
MRVYWKSSVHAKHEMKLGEQAVEVTHTEEPLKVEW